MPQDYDLQIKPADTLSLAAALLGDDGKRHVWTRRSWAKASAQLAAGRSWEIRYAGELLAIGGFIPDSPGAFYGADSIQGWFFLTSRCRAFALLRAAIDGICAMIEVEGEKYDVVTCCTDDAHPHAQKLVRLLGFKPSEVMTSDGLRVWYRAAGEVS